MKRLIFGCGYLGMRLARLWQAQGDQVICVTRSADRARQLAAAGFGTLVAEVTDPATLVNLPACDTALFAVGYDRTQSLPIETVYVQGLQNVLAALPANTGRIIYISSTGVYGHADGDWVDETTPCHPARDGGKACLAAEQELLASDRPAQKIILRLAGIYGPDRIPRRAEAQAQKPIPGLPDGYINLIHVDDAAAIAVQVAAQPWGNWADSPIFNVTDGHPVVRREYHRYLSELFGASAPTFVPPAADSTTQRGGSNKRVSNRRLQSALSPRFRYPDFREGLRASIAVARRD
jgi:nucleoside-diphosphate-sugar epimerase